jgi:hypothetical protein
LGGFGSFPGDLLVSESFYAGDPGIVAGHTQLPPGCTTGCVTSTVSGGGDQGADPSKLVEITDPLAAAAPAAGEGFRTVRTAGFGEVLRGASFAPGR